MECFDLRKLLWLIDAYRHPNVQISQRALVGIAFILHAYSPRIDFYPEINLRITALMEETAFEKNCYAYISKYFSVRKRKKSTKNA